MENGEPSLDPNYLRFLLPIVSDRFNRTTQQRFFTGGAFFLGKRLLIDERVTVRIRPAKVFRRGVTAYIAVDAGRIDVVSTGHVFLHAFVSIRQASFLSPPGSIRRSLCADYADFTDF